VNVLVPVYNKFISKNKKVSNKTHMITTFLRWIAQETKTSMNWHIYLLNWLAIKRSCFTLFQESLQKEKTKLIHKALLTVVVIVNVNKLSWFLKKHYFVQSFFSDRKLQNHFSIRQQQRDFWSLKQQDVKINSFVTCIEMFLCGHRHMTFRLSHILCAEEGSTTIFKWIFYKFSSDFFHITQEGEVFKTCPCWYIQAWNFFLNSYVTCEMRRKKETNHNNDLGRINDIQSSLSSSSQKQLVAFDQRLAYCSSV